METQINEVTKRVIQAIEIIVDQQFDGNKSRLAEALGRTPQNIYAITNEKRDASFAFVQDLCNKFDLNANYFMGKTNKMFNHV